ncbi:transmembrane protein, putative [Medicago truncatula]|uniref:Transmembrane protein, putative n=1 Tax=Medicago truncatula TaxID=3880 RepID=G7IYV6_MEDTR|nr:transmembrane protein, putative [Medicago truncatula]
MAKTDCFSPLMLMLARLLDFIQSYNRCLIFILTMLILFWIPNMLFERFNSNLGDNSKLGCIILACRHLFGYNFQNSHVEFNMRQANEVVHELASVATSHANSRIYDDVPSYIRDLMANEKE